jgi:hypothetical protein
VRAIPNLNLKVRKVPGRTPYLNLNVRKVPGRTAAIPTTSGEKLMAMA